MSDIDKIIEKERYWLNLQSLEYLNHAKMIALLLMDIQNFVRGNILWKEAERRAGIVFFLYDCYIKHIRVINAIN